MSVFSCSFVYTHCILVGTVCFVYGNPIYNDHSRDPVISAMGGPCMELQLKQTMNHATYTGQEVSTGYPSGL